MIMTAGREGEDNIASNKIDKRGVTTDEDKSENVTNKDTLSLQKIKTAQHVPKLEPYRYKNLYQDYSNNTWIPGFVTAGNNY